MRAFALAAVTVLAVACYDDPCSPTGACAGVVTGEVAVDEVLIGLEGMGTETPDMIAVSAESGGSSICEGSLRVWEVWDLQASDYPLVYGEAPGGAKEWVNEDLSPDGSVPPLNAGRRYVVDANIRYFDGSSMGLNAWSGTFVAGDPDSWQSRDAFCGL